MEINQTAKKETPLSIISQEGVRKNPPKLGESFSVPEPEVVVQCLMAFEKSF